VAIQEVLVYRALEVCVVSLDYLDPPDHLDHKVYQDLEVHKELLEHLVSEASQALVVQVVVKVTQVYPELLGLLVRQVVEVHLEIVDSLEALVHKVTQDLQVHVVSQDLQALVDHLVLQETLAREVSQGPRDLLGYKDLLDFLDHLDLQGLQD